MSEDFQQLDIPQSVLIVDEDQVVLKTLTLQLQDRGWDVRVANNSTKALELFSDQPTTVALVAIGMSDMDGMELAETLRRQVPDLVVILMTGYPTLSHAIEGLHHEAYDYLVKPFRIEQLMMGIERARRELGLIRENRELKQTIAELKVELERMTRPPETVEEEPVRMGEEEIPLPSAPYAGYSGVPGSGSGAIASYERQIQPSPSEPSEEEPTGPPEAATEQEGEQPEPSDP